MVGLICVTSAIRGGNVTV